MSKRQEILRRIRALRKGILFDCDSIISEGLKRGDVAVILCELKKAGEIKCLTKGVFYKPKTSLFGLGELPLEKEEIIRYFSERLDAHISGQYGYNLLGLTEQNAQTVTLAGKHRFKEFCIQNCRFRYMKSYVGYVRDKNTLSDAILLDALTNIEKVSGKTGSELFRILKGMIGRMDDSKQRKLIGMAGNYPTRTRYLLSKAIGKTSHSVERDTVLNICNKSKYDIEYKNIVFA